MKKTSRLLSGLLLIACGIAVIVFGMFIFTQSQDWMTYSFSAGVVLFGAAAVVGGGWAAMKGESILDILKTLFLVI